MRKIAILLAALTAILMLTAQSCAGSREYIIVDQRELLGDVSTEMTQPVDNMNGTQDLSQDIAASRQFRHSISLNLNESAGLNRQEVEDRILETYEIPSDTGDQMCLIPADVPAGSSYAYNMEWTQVLREGNIEEGSTPGVGDILGTYSIVIDLQCQVTGVNVLGQRSQ
jgi:hypothetical protein